MGVACFVGVASIHCAALTAWLLPGWSACCALTATRGARGVTCFLAGATEHTAAPAADSLDPTGAGDVFGVVYALRRQRGDERSAAIARAHLAAARSIEGPGVGRLAEVFEQVMLGPDP
jgi:sugar/nucleoside kinase (ribokinase family)